MIHKLKIVGLPITSVCNLRCAHCLRTRIKKYDQFEWNMSIEQAKHIASKIRDYTNCVNISAGYGETYLNPEVSTILKILKEQGLNTVAYTNATPATINRIIDSEVGLLLISIDSFHLSHNKKGIQQLLDAFHGDKHFAQKLRLNVVLQPQINESDLIHFVKSLCCKNPDVVAEFHWRNNYFSINEKAINEILTIYKTLFTPNEQIIPPVFEYYPSNKCKDIFNSLYFDEFGNVRTCCIFMNSNHRLNIYRHSIPEILSSKYMEEKRTAFRKNNGFKQCINCPIGHGFLW